MSYAGDKTPGETWEALTSDSKATLIDCRSEAEWAFVGIPDLTSIGKETLLLAWQHFPGMQVNQNFVTNLQAQVADSESPLYFLCRSGQRSQAAAAMATAAGYKSCYNVSEGFEGGHDELGHRGRVSGWKARDLPWRQG